MRPESDNRVRTDQGGVPVAPSAKTLAVASALALAAAAIILLVAVLPAEYGIDPLGTGKRLGFLALSQAGRPEPLPPPQGTALAPVREGNISLYPGEYKVDSRVFVLGPYEYVEFKYHLAKDAEMLFSWAADGDILQDFHGDRDGAASETPESYDKQPRRQSAGSFTAPFSGIHGWYWENPGGGTVTVKVTTAGFYTAAHEFTMKATRESRQVRGIDAIPVSDK
jgi:hypothetical protein